jgi:hypothetical protein
MNHSIAHASPRSQSTLRAFRMPLAILVLYTLFSTLFSWRAQQVGLLVPFGPIHWDVFFLGAATLLLRLLLLFVALPGCIYQVVRLALTKASSRLRFP